MMDDIFDLLMRVALTLLLLIGTAGAILMLTILFKAIRWVAFL